MAKTQTAAKEKQYTDEPPSLGNRAIDNLQFIRDTMERSTHFTAVPGYGAILMGVTAIAAAYIAHNQAFVRDWWITWIAEAGLAFAIGLLAMWQKSKLANTSLTSAPAKKFAMSFLPPLVCGIVVHARAVAVRALRVDDPGMDIAVRRRGGDGRRIFGKDRARYGLVFYSAGCGRILPSRGLREHNDGAELRPAAYRRGLYNRAAVRGVITKYG